MKKTIQYDVKIDTSRVAGQLESVKSSFSELFSFISSRSDEVSREIHADFKREFSKISSERVAEERETLNRLYELNRNHSRRLALLNRNNIKAMGLSQAAAAVASTGVVGAERDIKATGGTGIVTATALHSIYGGLSRRTTLSGLQGVEENISDPLEKLNRRSHVRNVSSYNRTQDIKNNIISLQNILSSGSPLKTHQTSLDTIKNTLSSGSTLNLIEQQNNAQEAANNAKEAANNAKEASNLNKQNSVLNKQNSVLNKENSVLNRKARLINKEASSTAYKVKAGFIPGIMSGASGSNKGIGKAALSIGTGMMGGAMVGGFAGMAAAGAIATAYVAMQSLISGFKEEIPRRIFDLQHAIKTFQSFPQEQQGYKKGQTPDETRVEMVRRITILKEESKQTRQAISTETGLTQEASIAMMGAYQEKGGRMLDITTGRSLGYMAQGYGLDPETAGTTLGLITEIFRKTDILKGEGKQNISDEALNKFGLGVVNVLAKSANKGVIDLSNINANEMGVLLSTATATTKLNPGDTTEQFMQNFQNQLANIFEIMQGSGLNAESAITGMKNFYNDLAISSHFKKLTKDYKINPYDDKGQYKNINSLIAEIFQKMGTSPVDLTKIFGIRSKTLLQPYSSRYEETLNRVRQEAKDSGKKLSEKELRAEAAKQFSDYLNKQQITVSPEETAAIEEVIKDDPAIKLQKSQEELSQNINNLAISVLPQVTEAIKMLSSMISSLPGADSTYSDYSNLSDDLEDENKERLKKAKAGISGYDDINPGNLSNPENLSLFSEHNTYEKEQINKLTANNKELKKHYMLFGERNGVQTAEGKRIKEQISQNEETIKFYQALESSPEEAINFGLKSKNPFVKELATSTLESSAGLVHKTTSKLLNYENVGRNITEEDYKNLKTKLDKEKKKAQYLADQEENPEKKAAIIARVARITHLTNRASNLVGKNVSDNPIDWESKDIDGGAKPISEIDYNNLLRRKQELLTNNGEIQKYIDENSSYSDYDKSPQTEEINRNNEEIDRIERQISNTFITRNPTQPVKNIPTDLIEVGKRLEDYQTNYQEISSEIEEYRKRSEPGERIPDWMDEALQSAKQDLDEAYDDIIDKQSKYLPYTQTTSLENVKIASAELPSGFTESISSSITKAMTEATLTALSNIKITVTNGKVTVDKGKDQSNGTDEPSFNED